jgi:intermediate peptidase
VVRRAGGLCGHSLSLGQSQRLISNVSSLQAAFNVPHTQRPHESTDKVGLFNIPELRDGAAGYSRLADDALAQAERLIQQARDFRGRTAVVDTLDDISNTLCKVADMADFVRFIHPEHAEEANKACSRISSLVETLNTDPELYNLLKEVMSSNAANISPDTHTVGSQLLHDFELSGIHLAESERAEAVQMNDVILEVGNNFVTGSNMPVAIQTSEVPSQFRDLLQPCPDMPDYSNISHTFCLSSDPELRWWAHMNFFYQEPIQENLLKTLLRKRAQLALHTGFPNYIHKAVEHSTIGGADHIQTFLDSVYKSASPHISTEMRALLMEKQRTEKTDTPLEPWDIQFYTERLRPAVDSVYKEYLSLGTCMQGLDSLFTAMMGVSLKTTRALQGETWDASVEKLCVTDESGAVLGTIYCDFIDRPTKPRQDCHFTITGGKLLSDGSYQTPVVALVCSFVPDPETGLVLLSIRELDNLVHEMGHAMHSMLARTRYQHVTGTRCVTDFAEVPSNMMELFVRDSRVLSSIARHHSSGQPMPQDLLLDLQRSRHFAWATDLHQQLLYSQLDQRLYSVEPMDISVYGVAGSVQLDYNPLTTKPGGTAPYLRFAHLFGYGAKYYSYLYCRALATSVWTHLFYQDPFSRTAGMAYRQKLLQHGGGKPPRHPGGPAGRDARHQLPDRDPRHSHHRHHVNT